MNPESVPIADFAAAAANPSVPELISRLRSSFFSSEFENAAKILTEREEWLNKRSIELAKKAECLANWGSEKMRLEDELRKKQWDLEAMGVVEAELEEAKLRVLELEKCKSEDEKKQQIISKRNKAEFDAMRKLNIENLEKIRVLEKEKSEVEAELRASKKKFFELDERVSSLEKTSEMLMGTDLERENQQEKKEIAAESSRTRLLGEDGDSSKGVDSSLARNGRSKPEITVIDDDDNQLRASLLKRKQVSSESKGECDRDDDDDSMPIGRKKRTNPRELHHQPKACNPFSAPHSVNNNPLLEKLEVNNPRSSLDSSQSGSHLHDNYVIDMYDDLLSNIEVQKEGWQCEANMLQAFNKDDELCMNAVCALHRQRIKRKLSFTGSPIVPANDASRITGLAQLLIDGHPQLKLKKRASEVRPSDIEDCRKLAHMHSTLLFDIFKKKEDHFFPSSRS